MEMRRLVSRISNSSSFVSWLLKSIMLGHTSRFDSRVNLTTPLGHETIRSSTDVQEPQRLDSESGFVCPFRVRDEPIFLYFLVFYAYPW